MQRAAVLAILGATAGAGCRLGPLVDDQPGASASVLSKDAVIPGVSSNPDLTTQIALNDSLTTAALVQNNNIIVRGTGVATGPASDAVTVRFWPFGAADRAPTPIYILGKGDPSSSSAFIPLTNHPPLVEAVPGDVEYAAVHTIFNVKVTDKYDDQKITTPAALFDAIDLGLVEPPVSIKAFVNWPIVRPGLKLEIGPGATAMPTPVYAHGYIVDSFPLGGALGRQPSPGLLPTAQVSFLRELGKPSYDRSRPVFQATVPPPTPGPTATYTPLCYVINVDLAQGRMASEVHKDGDLFVRSATGDIMTVNPNTNLVAQFTITTELVDLQVQLADGAQ